MSETKLLPCPLCGGKATTSEIEKIKTMPHGWGWVGCQPCRMFIDWSHGERGKKLAFAAWNTRKPMEIIVERLENNSFFTEPTYDMDGYSNDDEFEVVRLDKAIEIVKEEGGLND